MTEELNIHDDRFVEELFDNMSASYERMNYITSFGFSVLWRKQCVNAVRIQESEVVADLLTGMGECWPAIIKKTGAKGRIKALDFSEGMLSRARLKQKKIRSVQIDLLQENVFKNSIENNSIDVVISGFGIKTFSVDQLKSLALEIQRILKPEGRFSLIDVSVPQNKLLARCYLFYLKRIIPLLGWIFLGNPQTYKMLGIYTENFGNSTQAHKIFSEAGLNCEMESYFFGCASGISGSKM